MLRFCLCYEAADVKSESFLELAMGSRIWVDEDFYENGFLRTRVCGRWAYISERHVLASEDSVAKGYNAKGDNKDIDFVSTAERFLGVPYLYGGGCYAGIDCSALLQTAMSLHGIDCPRDADMQEGLSGQRGVGGSLGITDSASVDSAMSDLRRGDLIFWNRHVGIMLDGEYFFACERGFYGSFARAIERCSSAYYGHRGRDSYDTAIG